MWYRWKESDHHTPICSHRISEFTTGTIQHFDIKVLPQTSERHHHCRALSNINFHFHSPSPSHSLPLGLRPYTTRSVPPAHARQWRHGWVEADQDNGLEPVGAAESVRHKALVPHGLGHVKVGCRAVLGWAEDVLDPLLILQGPANVRQTAICTVRVWLLLFWPASWPPCWV